MDDLDNVIEALKALFEDEIGEQDDDYWKDKAEELIDELEERGTVLA